MGHITATAESLESAAEKAAEAAEFIKIEGK
jgi:hypothetical protein